MIVTHQFTTDPHDCSYLPGRDARLEYSYAPQLSPDEYEALMNEGCRKFGYAFFRPVCGQCQLCRPIRFDARLLKLDRSQRRALKRNKDLQIRIGEPVCDQQRMELFRRYHKAQREQKNWALQNESDLEYDACFIQNPIPGAEISAWQGDELRGVILTEITPNVVSAVYHYYDPAEKERGLGTFLILQCAELARQIGRRWVYLGYFVEGSASMAYKAKFQPSEVQNVEGIWLKME